MDLKDDHLILIRLKNYNFKTFLVKELYILLGCTSLLWFVYGFNPICENLIPNTSASSISSSCEMQHEGMKGKQQVYK